MEIVDNNLSGLVFRGAEATGLEIDSPWLVEEGGPLFVNGVDVVPFVDAELNRRFPGREQRRAADQASLAAAWAAVERTWAATVARAETMPAGTVDVQVGGEWSFSETLRHLVMATDVWLRKAVLGVEQPFHPVGRPNGDFDQVRFGESPFTNRTPTWEEVLAARADRVAMVRDFIASATPEVLGETRRNPWGPQHEETVLSCLHTILEEEWEHHRYAVRDLDALATPAG